MKTEPLKRMKSRGKKVRSSGLISTEKLTYGAEDLPSRYSGYETLKAHEVGAARDE